MREWLIFGAILLVVAVVVHGTGSDFLLWFMAGWAGTDMAAMIERRIKRRRR